MFLFFNCYQIPQLSYKFKRLAISLHHIILMVKIMLTFVGKICFILINVSASFFCFFFYQSFLSRTVTTHSTAGEGRGPSYSTLPLPPAHKHSDIYLQLWTWDDYHIFLIATLVFTRLLLDEIYHLIELLFGWLMM